MKRILPLLLCLLLIAGCTTGNVNEESDATPPATDAPSPTADAGDEESLEPTATPEEEPTAAVLTFKAVDQNGNEITEADFEGKKVIMLNFWATWCGPCVGELPELEQLYQTYGDDGFLLIGVLIEGTVSDAKSLIENNDITYPMIVADGDLVSMMYNFQYVPTTVFVDAQGNQLGELHVGSNDFNGWSQIVSNLLDAE